MCMMCVEIFKGRMTIIEGRRALKELLSTTNNDEQLKHYQELNGLSDEELKKFVAEMSNHQMLKSWQRR